MKKYINICKHCKIEYLTDFKKSHFCSILCSNIFYTEKHFKINKTNKNCSLCGGSKLSKEKYCIDCQIAYESFPKINNRCYMCNQEIPNFTFEYYTMHGRACLGCLRKLNNKYKDE